LIIDSANLQAISRIYLDSLATTIRIKNRIFQTEGFPAQLYNRQNRRSEYRPAGSNYNESIANIVLNRLSTNGGFR
jgi:hypothetical protein